MDKNIIKLDKADVVYAGKKYFSRNQVHAVKRVSLDISEREVLGLVGESGSGKSTLGRLCLGLVKPTNGEVLINGKPLISQKEGTPGERSIVLQHPEWALNPRLTIATSVSEPLDVMGTGSKSERKKRVIEMLEKVGLASGFASRYPHELSGGQRQRVAIARALITQPRFVVFDEAVSALDVSVQTQVLNLIRKLQLEERFAALFISHDIAATRYVSNRIAVMYAGEILEIADSSGFYYKPKHPYSRALLLSLDDQDRDLFELGESDNLTAPDGCILSHRCPWANDICRNTRPAIKNLQDTLVTCHRYEEIAKM